ncbi:pantoate--beta-alanine ligase [Acinetobacter portensis]|uniref:Pantothenate synthetase n=2 Tax=Acinetobacter TaxID=469 RepID=A0A6L6GD76_9GAMM|nr:MULTISPECIES: pantoate--beta-alanine ligase [Acinetobacter]MCK7608125.1 pantoate--beta-alanine ligase [Acinetobacter portensis]MCK7638909.1 pantoate--beta-alanine ligase [Acinetobacter portensis]MDY6461179.1 pantoate--beta-alanine ligase [Acinetobacter faecalis]MDY6489024.1 pantoate--beta-alanine ligase [Acinetobacter faecalis]MDY6524935.1 pantoate--beta-alanine ligase [Acinetobacter faecalis]
MKIESTIQGLSESLKTARTNQKIIGLVPTMGNLHQGHLNLVREARKKCDIVVVSIFVNPIQFGPNEDYDSYPRTLEQDSKLLEEVGCDYIFAPTVEQMYGNQPRLTNISVSGITADLCGLQRPGHFDGVAVVVTKLFNIVRPEIAFFGEKDFQQLAVIRQFVRDLNMPIEITGVPIARAEDGLALSSRNGYLSEEHRKTAPIIHQCLKIAEQDLQQGKKLADVLANIASTLTQAGFVIDYVEARTPELQKIEEFNQNIVLFIAAKIGTTRLIDNLQVQHNA